MTNSNDSNNILNKIGNTPLLHLKHFSQQYNSNIYAKAEFFNPGGSIKDRIGLSMILAAQQNGKLYTGATIIEPTSGNTGIAIAWIGAVLGYRVILVMPETMSVERRSILKAYGAEIVLSPGKLGMRGAITRANELLAEIKNSITLGQFENMARAWERLQLIIPITLFVICMLLYANTKSWPKTAIILMAVPFSAVGAIWILYLLGYNFSIAVWVGLIALLGVDAETGIFMLLYLDLAYESAKKEGRMINFENLKAAISFGAVKRVRPKIMTVSCLIMALLPIMWASTANAGADVMKRIAAPMLGGIVTSFAMELMVYPAIFAIWKWYFEVNSKTELT